MSTNIQRDTPTENPENKDMNRRSFLKKMGIVNIGLLLGWASFDKVSQKIREITNVKYVSDLAKTIEEIKRSFPEVAQWSSSNEWATDILIAFEENNLELTDENLGIILTIIRSSSGFRSDPRAVDFIPTPSEKRFHQMGIKSPKTSGPMETSVEFVMDKEKLNYEEAVELLTNRGEGLKLGIAFLKKMIEEYSTVEDVTKRIMCIFADYNAGRGASKRAGIQSSVSTLSGRIIEKDGVLGKETIDAVDDLFKRNNIPISGKDIEDDVDKENEYLTKTPTYKKLCALAKVESIEPEIAAARVQGIMGFLKESLTGVRTSKDYAEKRFEEFEKILLVIKGFD